MKQSPAIPSSRNARIIVWDEAHDQSRGTTYYGSPQSFGAALLAAERRNRETGAGYRIGYDGPRSVAIFEWWCACVWSVLDGDRPTYVIVEELGAVCPHPGEATPAHRRILSEGRKFAMCYHATTQRPQEISKTVFENCATWWVGQQKGVNHKRFADHLDVDEAQIRALKPLEFLVHDERAGPVPARRVQLRYSSK